MKSRKALTALILIAAVFLGIGAELPVSAASGCGTYTVWANSGVNMREYPAVDSDRVWAVDHGITVTVTSRSGDWGYCTHQGHSGWINLMFAAANDGQEVISDGYYTLTSGLDGSVAVDVQKGVMYENTPLQLFHLNGDNAQILYSTYIGNGYYKISPANSSDLAITAVDNREDARIVLSEYTGGEGQLWRPYYQDQSYYTLTSKYGYCMDAVKGQTADGTPLQQHHANATASENWKFTIATPKRKTIEAHTLAVPLYKQSDSRWRWTRIGSRTIGGVGCLVTSIAMKYSFETGSTVYPDAMVNKLDFDNNDLLWASTSPYNWTHKTFNCAFGDSVRNTILDGLAAGKPVVVGCRKNSHKSHWVLVVGCKKAYTDRSTVTAADLLINDPAYSNATLADLMKKYPTVIATLA